MSVTIPQIIKAPSLNNIGWSKTATLELPLDGSRIKRINFHVDAFVTATPANLCGLNHLVDEIIIEIGGRPVQVWTPDQLEAAVNVNGDGFFGNGGSGAAKNTYFSIPFDQDWRRSETEAIVLGWPTAGLTARGVSIVVKLRFKAEIATVTIRSVTATLEIDQPINPQTGALLQMGQIWKSARDTINSTTAGKHVWQNIPRVDALYRLHFFSSRISEIEVFAGRQHLYSLKAEENRQQLKRRGFNPQDDVFHVILDRSQTLNGFIPLGDASIGQIRFDITHASAGAPYDVVYELIGPASR